MKTLLAISLILAAIMVAILFLEGGHAPDLTEDLPVTTETESELPFAKAPAEDFAESTRSALQGEATKPTSKISTLPAINESMRSIDQSKLGGISAKLMGFGKHRIPDRIQVTLKRTTKSMLIAPGSSVHLVDCTEGRMEITPVPPGRYSLEFFIPDLRTRIRTFTVEAKRTTDLGRIYFLPQGAIAGIILDEKGRPLPGVSVYPKRPFYHYAQSDTEKFLEAIKPSTKSNKAGRFQTTGYIDPWIAITFVAKGYAPLELRLTNADQARNLFLRMQRASSLEFTDWPRFTKVDGKKIPLMLWQLKLAKLPPTYATWTEHPLLQGRLRIALPRFTDIAKIPDLPPGRYQIQLLDFGDKIFAERKVRLIAGKTHRVTWN